MVGVTATVGIIANPAAGKDIRRLISAASPVSDMAKIGIVRRVVVGAVEGGAERVLIADDHRSFGAHALRDLPDHIALRAEIVGDQVVPTGANSRIMARALRDRGVDALVVLGGDGTHRDVVKGWRDAVLVGVSTGTNNVFPRMIEATVAGHAAAVAARAERRPDRLATFADRSKLLDVRSVGDSELSPDLALVDLALLSGRFTASRAVWDPSALQELVVTTAEPETIGLSAVAAQVHPLRRDELGAVHLRLGHGDSTGRRLDPVEVRAPIAPGRYESLVVTDHARLRPRETVQLCGPGVLAFDGERDRVLNEGDVIAVTVAADGPWVVDPARALAQVSTATPNGGRVRSGRAASPC